MARDPESRLGQQLYIVHKAGLYRLARVALNLCIHLEI